MSLYQQIIRGSANSKDEPILKEDDPLKDDDLRFKWMHHPCTISLLDHVKHLNEYMISHMTVDSLDGKDINHYGPAIAIARSMQKLMEEGKQL